MPYRSDEQASKARRAELERELADVKARSTEVAYLHWRSKEIEKELGDLAKRESAFEQKKRLPMLANAKIASPCSADWNAMQGDEQVRYCGKCEKSVYNLSEMTAEAAEALIVEREGKMCVRFYTRTDGTVLTKDCGVGVRRKWATRAGAAAVLFGGGAAALSAFAPKVACHTMGAMAELPHTTQPAVMGSFAPPPIPPPPDTATPATAKPTAATPNHQPAMMGRIALPLKGTK
ncbi:MAG: hypothetical protein ABI551_11845 [Polyangiaceae bacterium]